jgi:hypothetical protein
MKTRIALLALFSFILLAPQWAFAGVALPTPSQYSGKSETVFSLGIQFDFGDMQPEIIGAVRHTNTDKGNDVVGGKLDVAVPLLGDDNFIPTVRVLGLAGSRDVQGEAGLGFDFAAQQALVGAGVQVPYVNGGVNLQFDGEWHPYLGVNSYDGATSRESESVLPPPPPP